MPTVTIYTERQLHCPCTALSGDPFPECPLCKGAGWAWQEVLVEVEYAYTPPCRGAHERGTGLALEPDEPARVEIQWTSITLTQEEGERAQEAAERDAMDRAREALEAREDRAYETWKERQHEGRVP